jgi:2-polyprenyl-3-methyl-5-hydroxy-6-metoxy-1,4-benzoquinol methylase
METNPGAITNSEYYDDIYRNNPHYINSYKDSNYYKIWMKTLEYIPEGSTILDVGCGPGQYAKLIEDHSQAEYMGIDFSYVAIEKARNTAKGTFICSNVLKDGLNRNDYDIVVVLEFLEHIKDDIGFLETLPADIRIIATVPNYLSKGHFRTFDSLWEVVDHYHGVIWFDNVHEFQVSSKNKIYLFNGSKK